MLVNFRQFDSNYVYLGHSGNSRQLAADPSPDPDAGGSGERGTKLRDTKRKLHLLLHGARARGQTHQEGSAVQGKTFMIFNTFKQACIFPSNLPTEKTAKKI